MTATFYLSNREAKREFKVYANNKLLPFRPVSTYLEVKLDRSPTFRHHLETLRKKLATPVTLLRLLACLGWSAGPKTLRTAALFLVYATADYCSLIWCRSAHTRLIDSVLNDVLRFGAGCLCPIQRTTCQFFQASSQLSFAAWERHYPRPNVAPWTRPYFTRSTS